MRELAIRLSEILYKWVLVAPGHKEYHQVYENMQGAHYGMMWTFVFLLVISIVAAAIYYFVVSSSIENANKKNYWIVCALGLLTLTIVTVVGLRLISGYNAPEFFSVNLLKINLINIVYYAVFFEIWSIIFKPFSKSTIDFFSK